MSAVAGAIVAQATVPSSEIAHLVSERVNGTVHSSCTEQGRRRGVVQAGLVVV